MVVGLSSFVLLTQFGIKLFGFNAIVPALVFGLIAFILGNQFGTKKTVKTDRTLWFIKS